MAPEQLYRSASVRPYRRPIQAEEKKHITKKEKRRSKSRRGKANRKENKKEEEILTC